MAERRQPFLFRLPWLSATNAPPTTPDPQPSSPTPVIQAPTQPTSTSSVPRPPFRPAGIAPPQPSQAPPTLKTEPLPPAPSRAAATESRVPSQPTSPSRTTQTRMASVPPPESQITSRPASPPRGTTQTRAASVPPPESRVTSQPASPSRARTQMPVASQTRSPSRAATQLRAASVPPSPSRTPPTRQPTQAAPKPRSPTRLSSQSTGQKSSQPSSPMRKSTHVQPTVGVVSQPLSPPKQSEQSTKETSQAPYHPLASVTQETEAKETSQPFNITHPLSSVSHERQSKPGASKHLPQEPRIKSEIVSKSQHQTAGDTISTPDLAAARPEQASEFMTTMTPTPTATPGGSIAPERQESNLSEAEYPKPLQESERRMKGTKGQNDVQDFVKEAKPEGGKVVALEVMRQGKIDGSADQQMPRTITELLTAATGLETRREDLFGSRIKIEERNHEKHDIFEMKKSLSTSKSDEKHIRTVSPTHAKERNTQGNHQKPDMSNGERPPLHKEIQEDISKFVDNLDIGHLKQPIYDRPVSIITIAGENRGASMQLGPESATKDGAVPIYRGYKLTSDEIPETTTDGEGSSKGRSPRDSTTKRDQASRAYINSNIQSINNSVMFNSSVNERNTGVHIVYSHNQWQPTKTATKPQETPETHGHKAEVSIIPAEKLTYQPTVRRRCLRGLLMEPSDSDPDNPEKHRRHGCLYNCGERSKDKDIGVL